MTEIARVTVEQRRIGGLRDLAESVDAGLLWLVAAEATAGDDALAHLRASGRVPSASLPLDATGEPEGLLVGGFADEDPELLLAAVSDRVVPLRHTPIISLLVNRDDVLALNAPDPGRFGPYADIEWTARLFARQPGVLVPASRVLAPSPPNPDALAALRMARASVWRRTELGRELGRLVGR